MYQHWSFLPRHSKFVQISSKCSLFQALGNEGTLIKTYNYSGPARGFGYTVSQVFFTKVFGIFLPKCGYKVFFSHELLVFCIKRRNVGVFFF